MGEAGVRHLVRAYEEWSKASGRWTAEAREVFPGGDTRMSAHYAPYPLFIEEAAGCRMVDADGHRILDFMNNFTSLIHGHAHPDVVAAVTEQVRRGSAYAAPTRSQLDLGKLLLERVPSLELLRFTSSGTEATLMAVRCARAATGRQRIAKMEGGYHGSYEAAEVSLVPIPGKAGAAERPSSLPVDASFPESVLREVLVLPYNDPDHAVALVEENAQELACLLVEPMLGSMGMLPATREFLAALREVTARHDIVLVFDEVITLRVGPGGMQSLHGVTPDLTAMGKIIGGGLPIGAVGGRRELMELFDPGRREPVMHASTFSGNPLSMAAGLAAMRAYDTAQRERIEGLGDRLRSGFDRAFERVGIRGRALGAGSLANVHFGAGPFENARDALAGMSTSTPLGRLLHLGMLRRGVASASRLMYCISTPMSETEIDEAVEALQDTLVELRPIVASERPELLS
jgi:glutamate-1-semialdehyde 2,1-aminomutase